MVVMKEVRFRVKKTLFVQPHLHLLAPKERDQVLYKAERLFRERHLGQLADQFFAGQHADLSAAGRLMAEQESKRAYAADFVLHFFVARDREVRSGNVNGTMLAAREQ